LPRLTRTPRQAGPGSGPCDRARNALTEKGISPPRPASSQQNRRQRGRRQRGPVTSTHPYPARTTARATDLAKDRPRWKPSAEPKETNVPASQPASPSMAADHAERPGQASSNSAPQTGGRAGRNGRRAVPQGRAPTSSARAPDAKPQRAVTPISARQLLRRRSPRPAGAPRSPRGGTLRGDELAPAGASSGPTTASAAAPASAPRSAQGQARLSARCSREQRRGDSGSPPRRARKVSRKPLIDRVGT